MSISLCASVTIASDDGLKVAALIVSLVSFAVSSAVAIFAIRVNRRLKAMDVVVKCQEQYDRIAFDARHGVTTLDDARLYFDRFWSLQWNQFEFWEDGAIGKDRYGFWMFCRNQEWNRNESAGGMSYQEGWKWAVQHHGWSDTKFVDHMEAVFAATSPVLLEYCKHNLRSSPPRSGVTKGDAPKAVSESNGRGKEFG